MLSNIQLINVKPESVLMLMESDPNSNFEAWVVNFRAAVDRIMEHSEWDTKAPGFAMLLHDMNDFFWGRFKKPKDIEGFMDEKFFLELARISLRGASLASGKSEAQVSTECFELGVKKNKDYGSDNILRFGTMGLIVRMGDKINRLNNLVKNGGNRMVEDEKEIDTMMDVFNYATYGMMLSRGIWF